MSALENIPPAELGALLRSARNKAGKTQLEAADAIGAARTTLVAIESGHRRTRIEETQVLCRLYGTSVNALLRAESLHLDFEPRFRKLATAEAEFSLEAGKLLSDLVRAEVELENLLGIKRTGVILPEKPIQAGNVKVQAEQDALELRQWLGLGSSPILDVISLLELTIGVRVYVRAIDGRISGAFIYDVVTGPCMLLNANHPRSRRNQSGIHELAHYLTSRNSPQISRQDVVTRNREEQYADAFARAFLTPARTVMEKFREITAGSRLLSRRHVIILANYFGVSREALVRRLEELELAKRGTWDWFHDNGGISADQAKEVLRDSADAESDQVGRSEWAAVRLNLLAEAVFRQGLMSEGQLSRLLGIGRVELREILEVIEDEGEEAQHGTALPR